MSSEGACTFCDRLINPRSDPKFLLETECCIVFAGDHQVYPGYCVLVAKSHVREVYQLPSDEFIKLMLDLRGVAQKIGSGVSVRKMNIASFGNVVEHLHWHIVPRRDSDRYPRADPWRDEASFAAKPTLQGDVGMIRELLSRPTTPSER